jgi:ornithine--oxo-acid transaminase
MALPDPAHRAHATSPDAGQRSAGRLLRDLEDRHCAHNYDPLPVVLTAGEGAWVTDVEGRRYLDLLAGYSALNFGHRHPDLVRAARDQLDRLTLTSRAFHSDQLGPFCAELAALCGKDAVLPMNTGAEAVETGIKLARKWGYVRKGIPADQAEIVVCRDSFHGRTTTIVGFSTDESARRGFGPYTPGFRLVPYGDADAVAAAITPHTAAVLVEPIQGEAGVIVPPAGYLRGLREICAATDVLLVADEIQSGLGRTGTTFGCDLDGVTPDVYLLGKALGGGIVPLSAVVANWTVLDVIGPGEHGSTFGGNPLACAVGREVIRLVRHGGFQSRSRELGAYLADQLRAEVGDRVAALRAVGLWIGLDLPPGRSARAVCERLMTLGVLAKDTHGRTIRLAPPLVVEAADLDFAVAQFATALAD